MADDAKNQQRALDAAQARIRELESRIEGMIEPHSDEQKRIADLETALRSVRTILQSDSIGYDDMRHIEGIIDAALAGSVDREGEP